MENSDEIEAGSSSQADQSSSQPHSTEGLDDLLAGAGGLISSSANPNHDEVNVTGDPLQVDDNGAGGNGEVGGAYEMNAIPDQVYVTTTTRKGKISKRLSLNGYQ